MAQDYGAAQPIADWVNKYMYGPAKALTGAAKEVSPQSKQDDSYLAERVKAANESFRKAAADPKLGQRKAAAKKKATKKKAAAKR